MFEQAISELEWELDCFNAKTKIRDRSINSIYPIKIQAGYFVEVDKLNPNIYMDILSI